MKTLQNLSEKYSEMLIKGGADPQYAYKYKYGFVSQASTLMILVLIIIVGRGIIIATALITGII